MEPPSNILSLPEEVLYIIFSHLRRDQVYRGLFDWTRYDDRSKLQTIKAARLVCRLFNQIASPLLCPRLRLRLDHASLEFVDKVSKSSLIAEGVYYIEIGLDYCPRELATDLSRFTDRRIRELIRLYDNLISTAEWCPDAPPLEWNEEGRVAVEGCPIIDNGYYPYSDYIQASQYISRIWQAWSELLSTTSEDREAEDATSLFQLILQKGHQGYIQKHEEQFQLLTDGSFVNRLVLAISRMKCCASLGFVDDVDCYSLPDDCSPIILQDNTQQIHQLLSAPLSWNSISNLEGGAEILPARLLWDLPIATYQAGSILRALRIHSFPHQSYLPIDCSLEWANLRAASKHLEVFSYGGTTLCSHHWPFQPWLAKKKTLIERYLRAVLRSTVLEAVDLSLHDNIFHATVVSYRIGRRLRAINWPRIRNLRIDGISLTQDELEGFCSGLGTALEDIYLTNIEVRDGSWASALDMLRERVPKRRKKPSWKHNFLKLRGGEFGKKNKELVKLAQTYVLGLGVDKNPLRDMGQAVS